MEIITIDTINRSPYWWLPSLSVLCLMIIYCYNESHKLQPTSVLSPVVIIYTMYIISRVYNNVTRLQKGSYTHISDIATLKRHNSISE